MASYSRPLIHIKKVKVSATPATQTENVLQDCEFDGLGKRYLPDVLSARKSATLSIFSPRDFGLPLRASFVDLASCILLGLAEKVTEDDIIERLKEGGHAVGLQQALLLIEMSEMGKDVGLGDGYTYFPIVDRYGSMSVISIDRYKGKRRFCLGGYAGMIFWSPRDRIVFGNPTKLVS